ncbi:MAG: hypothetical protein HQK99_13630 [Nitrospirae bacterium]|nr:hypothetical protein [Nitrospirota bacterium]
MMINQTKLLKLSSRAFLDEYQDSAETICNTIADLYRKDPDELRVFLMRLASGISHNSKRNDVKAITLCSQSPRRKVLLEIVAPHKKIQTIENGNNAELYLSDYSPKDNTLNIALQKMVTVHPLL